jgi:hypothetical protein
VKAAGLALVAAIALAMLPHPAVADDKLVVAAAFPSVIEVAQHRTKIAPRWT